MPHSVAINDTNNIHSKQQTGIIIMKLKSIAKLITTSLGGTAIGVAALGAMSVNAADYKHIAVAPEQIEAQKIVAAESKGLFSHSTMLPVYTTAAQKGIQVQEQKIYLDAVGNNPIVLLSPDAQSWFISLSNPQGEMVYDELSNVTKTLQVNDIQVGSQSFKGKQLSLSNPVSGEWTVKLTRKNDGVSSVKGGSNADKTVAGYLVFKGDTELQAYSYLDNNFTTQNNDINVIAYMADTTTGRGERALMVKKDALQGTISSAVATVKSPSGKIFTLALNDDGLMGDKLAGDGKFSGKVPSDEIGVYTNQVQFKGQRDDGKLFSRTTTDIYPIAAASFELSNAAAQLKQIDKNSALVSVPVKNLDNSSEVFMAAEVWGTNAKGEQQVATWIGGIVTPSNDKANTTLELAFDTRWLSRGQLKAPYSLKGLRLQSVDTNVPLAQREEVALKSRLPKASKDQLLQVQNISQEITREMRMGKSPVRAEGTKETLAGGAKLLLVHGYCSGDVWNTNQFSNSAEFQNFGQNISHDTFAQRVASFGAAYDSYGIVAHSQGGAAALQLYSKYWSGLDDASGGRLIQSVGTPYQGTALAGNLAALGAVFGAGCGLNTDLTYNGASNWLSTVPTWARNAVNYYTTSFTDKWWQYNYCHIATDLFLDDPDDGTTEQWAGQLSSGVNRGHKTGWCHTNSMGEPGQTTDSSRNSTMSSNAAR